MRRSGDISKKWKKCENFVFFLPAKSSPPAFKVEHFYTFHPIANIYIQKVFCSK